MKIHPFVISVPEPQLTDLAMRLAQTRWPDEIEGIGWSQGTNRDYLKSLAGYWRSGFDWRKQEAALNRHPQYKAIIGDQEVHFVHARAKSGRGFPIILTHGWPGSFAEMARIIPMLTDPAAFGADPDDAFDVVVPSLPGFGYSAPPRQTGMNALAVAKLWAGLMAGLGYERFGAQGGDLGAGISTCLGMFCPERLVGLHLNFIPGSFQPPHLPATQDMTAEETEFVAERAAWVAAEGGYSHMHATKPQTLAYSLNDSPAGLAAWIVEKFRAWSDCNGDLESVFSKDELLTNISIYWFTQTIGSSMRAYWEGSRRPLHFAPGERVRVPCAVVRFPKELLFPPRSWVEQVYDMHRWTQMARGGHFAALEQPEALAKDIRAFFAQLRNPGSMR